MATTTLHDAFVSELRDTLSAEKQITKALRQMVRGASHEQLREAFEGHLEETEQHIERLEMVFESLDLKARARHCSGMSGIIDEGKEVLQDDMSPETKDAKLMAAAQKVEHYEIASYGTLCTWAEMLEYTDAMKLLKQTLDEEKRTDEKLTELSSQINKEALAAQK